jgi:hypothetical protein
VIGAISPATRQPGLATLSGDVATYDTALGLALARLYENLQACTSPPPTRVSASAIRTTDEMDELFYVPQRNCGRLGQTMPAYGDREMLELISAGLNRDSPTARIVESGSVDSDYGGGSMPRPCSLELRERVVNAVVSGASRREAADWFDVSPSSAIKWMQLRQATGKHRP